MPTVGPEIKPPPVGGSKEEVRNWLRSVLSVTEWSATKLANEAGVAPSTVNRFLNAEVEHNLSATTLGRIVSAIQTHRRTSRRADHQEDAHLVGAAIGKGNFVMISEIDHSPAKGQTDGAAALAATPDKAPREWGFPEDWFRFTFRSDPANVRIISVDDEGGVPLLNPGDKLAVDTARTVPSPPGIFIIDDGMSFIPKHVELLAHSDPVMCRVSNPGERGRFYDCAPERLQIYGRVIGMWRRM